MDDLPGTLEQLTARLQALEQRVSLLESPAAVSSSPITANAETLPAPQGSEGLSFVQADGLFSVVGRALLGIAGAYLLRAVAESTSLPRLAVAAIAIAYALMWLVWAARVKAETWVPNAIYAGTSALILAPMLWELTLSFKVLSPPATASILAAFVLAASALAWKRDLAPVFWVANITAAAASLALAIATHQLIPFIATLLFMVLICEFAAERNHELILRPMVAAAADLAIWALIFIYSSPQSSRADYPSIGTEVLLTPACVLFLIYAATVAIRTTVLGQNITVFETLQAMIALLLAGAGLLSFELQSGAVVLGVVCLFLAAACNALAFAVARGLATGRNYQVFSAWGTGLLVTGSILFLGPLGRTLCLGLAAIAFTLLGASTNRLTLRVHGLVLLLAGAFASGMPAYAFHALAGSLPIRLTVAVCDIAACSIVCYAADKPASAETWMRQFLRLVPAALAICFLAALLVQGLLSLSAPRIAPDIYYVAFIRTLTCCVVALSSAFAGARWRRLELTRMAYATLAFVAAKLVFEDLRHGHLEFIAASIFLFAITLIIVPRLARMGQKV